MIWGRCSLYKCRRLVRRGGVFWVLSRRVRQLARPRGVEGMLLLGPRRTAWSGLGGLDRLWARRVDLWKLGVLEPRVWVVRVVWILSNLLRVWRLRLRGRKRGECRADRTWDVRKLRIDWTREDVFLII